MTTFVDGPAKGQHLMLKRAAKYLRVVEAAGKFDGLDQLNDSPGDNEKIYAYELHDNHGMCHINAGRGRSGFYPMVSYRMVAHQPPDAEMRTNKAWQNWCLRTLEGT